MFAITILFTEYKICQTILQSNLTQPSNFIKTFNICLMGYVLSVTFEMKRYV